LTPAGQELLLEHAERARVVPCFQQFRPCSPDHGQDADLPVREICAVVQHACCLSCQVLRQTLRLNGCQHFMGQPEVGRRGPGCPMLLQRGVAHQLQPGSDPVGVRCLYRGRRFYIPDEKERHFPILAAENQEPVWHKPFQTTSHFIAITTPVDELERVQCAVCAEGVLLVMPPGIGSQLASAGTGDPPPSRLMQLILMLDLAGRPHEDPVRSVQQARYQAPVRGSGHADTRVSGRNIKGSLAPWAVVILASLVAAREAIARRNINRFLALWGDCSISVASFTALPEKYGDDLRSEEHTSELQSRFDLVCRLLLEKKKKH